jgi:uncharacterized Zn finger protein
MSKRKDESDRSLMSSGVHSRPKDAEDGIKSKSRRGKFGESWWADRWIGVLQSFGWGSRLERGRAYARRGQTLSLDVKPGKITARVQGSASTPYEVEISFPTLKPQTWEKVFDALASKAVFAAKLLAGDMPHEIEEAFYSAGTWLFPKDVRELGSQCTCPDFVRPCKHLAAVHYMVAEAFDEDPFLLFTLRGKTKDEIAAALRERRASIPEPASGTPAPAPGARVEEPIVLSPERFFDLRADARVTVHLDPPHPAVAALGPLRLDREDALPEIEKIVARLREGALALAFSNKETNGHAKDNGASG